MRRKLFTMVLALALGISIGYMTDITINYILAKLTATALFAVAFFGAARNRRKVALILGLTVIAGFLLMAGEANRFQESPLRGDLGVSKTFHAKVLQIDEKEPEKFYLTCEIEGSKGIKARITYYDKIIEPHRLVKETIEFTTDLEEPRPASNPRCFDYKLFLRTKSIGAIGTITSYKIVKGDNLNTLDRLYQRIMKTREDFARSLGEEGPATGFILGILFGDTNSIDDDIYKEFKENGTAHVLAVSGLHIGIIFTLFKRIFGRRRSLLVEGVFIGLLLCYGTLTLWSVSATRAIAMVILSVIGDRNNCRVDLTTSLGLVAAVILFGNPYQLLSAGFQMSFIAVASIAFIAPRLETRLDPDIAMVVGVQLGMIPYIAYTFNYVSILSLICNIPVVYLVSVFMPLGMGGLLLFTILGQIPAILMALMEGLAEVIIKVNHAMAINGFFCADVVSPPLWAVVLVYMLMFFISSETFMLARERGSRDITKAIAVILLIAVVTIPQSLSPVRNADIVFVDVGQGDGIHLRSPGKNILLDGGGSQSYNIGEQTLKPYFLKNGTSKLDLAMVTHLHTDHFLGVKQLSKEMNIESFVYKGKKGQVYEVGDVRLQILWPLEGNARAEDENLNSMVIKAWVDGVSLLVTGDIGETGEKLLIAEYSGTDVLKCDILKVAHHGSKYSSCEEFIDAVSPKIAVIQVGKNNYGHPDKGVIEKFYKKGIMVYRTDHDGAVGIICNKGKMKVWRAIQATEEENTVSRCSQTT